MRRRGDFDLRDLTQSPRAVTAPISELQIDAKGAVKIKTADRLHAIDSLLHTGWLAIAAFPHGGAANAGVRIHRNAYRPCRRSRQRHDL